MDIGPQTADSSDDGELDELTPQSRPQNEVAKRYRFIREVELARVSNPRATLTSVGYRSEYGFSKSVCSKTWSNRASVIKRYEDAPRSAETITRCYPRKQVLVEEALYLAFFDERANGLPVTDSRLKELAYYFYVKMIRRQKPGKNMALDNFRFSSGWLEGFKKKYTLVKRDSHGQRGDVDIPLHTPRFEEIAEELSA
ncbi:hypothetical protein BGZ96_008174 [Linnemannia gamsii]|uniref:HTH CENPB-type domain-containing protein n=1 Tax=Linnemannia gamsii TaxID=64522 RepID=A0ABQ7JZ09_9FUNG|nr:hypothetical protein BGZ96_008174 [Linnemannia gamsii]